jgi:hypothetical protein
MIGIAGYFDLKTKSGAVKERPILAKGNLKLPG